MSRPGTIHWLPRALSRLQDSKEHRLHVVLNNSVDRRHAATIYGTGSSAETQNGTIVLAVKPRNENGLTATTYFYPVVFRPAEQDELDNSIGSTTSQQLRELKGLIGIALGFGSGNRYAQDATPGSQRGVIVRVDSVCEDFTGTPFAVVLTSHVYAAKKDGFLAVIPLLLDFDPEPGHDVLIEHVMSFEELDPGAGSAIMLATNIYSLRRETQIKAFTHLVVPTPQLQKAEEVLGRWLEIPS